MLLRDTPGTPKSGHTTAAITRAPFDVAHVKNNAWTWMQMSSSIPMAAKASRAITTQREAVRHLRRACLERESRQQSDKGHSASF